MTHENKGKYLILLFLYGLSINTAFNTTDIVKLIVNLIGIVLLTYATITQYRRNKESRE